MEPMCGLPPMNGAAKNVQYNKQEQSVRVLSNICLIFCVFQLHITIKTAMVCGRES